MSARARTPHARTDRLTRSLPFSTVVRRRANVGDEVGYAVRFDECWHRDSTRIKFVTDGMLVAEMLIDPLLSRYSVIMVDEAHERSVHTDVLLGLLKRVQRKRPELRLIIASATVDAQACRALP